MQVTATGIVAPGLTPASLPSGHLHTSKLVGLFEYCVQEVLAGHALAGVIEKDLQIG
jgi:hypothetical protein